MKETDNYIEDEGRRYFLSASARKVGAVMFAVAVGGYDTDALAGKTWDALQEWSKKKYEDSKPALDEVKNRARKVKDGVTEAAKAVKDHYQSPKSKKTRDRFKETSKEGWKEMVEGFKRGFNKPKDLEERVK